MISPQKRQLLDLIKRRGTLSLDEATEATGLTRTTLREHFSQLERDGYISREYVRHGPGRPSLQYQLSEGGEFLFPSREPEMLRDLIRYLKYRGLESLVEAFFRQYWERRLDKAEQLFADHPGADTSSRLELLSGMLEEEGFMPEVSRNPDSGEPCIRECNCPFREVIKETDLPCRLEMEFYKSLFEEDIKRDLYIPNGDHACSYAIPSNQ